MIFVILGKSATGKDTIFQKLMEHKEELAMEEVIPYTTRPIRSGEINGKEYFFVTEAEMNRLAAAGKVIEHRVYQTIHGTWNYFTLDDEKLHQKNRNFLLIATLEAYENIRDFYGKEMVIPIYLVVDDFTRLERAIRREREQYKPSCAEVCRRYLADEEDFLESKLIRAGIAKKFVTVDVENCCHEIMKEIKSTG